MKRRSNRGGGRIYIDPKQMTVDEIIQLKSNGKD